MGYPFVRFEFVSSDERREDWKKASQNVFLHGEVFNKRSKDDLNTIISEKIPQTLTEQLQFLSRISNNPYSGYPLAGNTELLSTRKPRLHQHLLYSPLNSNDPSSVTNNDFAATSFRQRTLHFLFFASKLDRNYARKFIRTKIYGLSLPPRGPIQTPIEKRRRHRFNRRRNHNETTELVQNEFQGATEESQYKNFEQAVFTKGILILRAFCSNGGFLVMNDYSTHHGTFFDSKFVHIRYTKDDHGQVIIKCTCSDFRKTGGIGAENYDLPTENVLTTRCMHTRLLYSKLENSLKQIPNVRIFDCPRLQKQLLESCHSKANASIVLVSKDDLLVLSVSKHPKSMPCFVTVNPKTHSIKCLGRCKNNFARKRSKNPYFSLDEIETEKLCYHVRAVVNEESIVDNFLSDESKIQCEPSQEDEEFCVETGYWKRKALGKHKPLKEHDPLFIA